ncbi:MAG: LysR family transcriptional regulator [Fulvimarina manganoxydans]|uniref:LysR family transcriptional regulator n=1 Tax=Fulvimarina manganoxydans TaxID=937218 RepID=UPI0023577D9A|nr:LysR family transcriptional regulator [Fulvimarina manganoxydans]MCK5933957.1 LysR family transcriptional regulator [Fulvimarina manganoxydans]
MKEIKPIRVFLEVAAQRSFAAAAKSLRMTPASVTRVVARLEQDLGQQLLLRTTRQVSLTSAGAIVAARYRPVVETFDQIRQELERDMQPHRGRLSINAPMSFGLRLLPGLVSSFRRSYPEIDLVVRLTDRLVDIVAEEGDLAIRVSEPPRDKSPIWRKICEVPRRVVAAKSVFDHHARPKDPDGLDPSLCLSYGPGSELETWRFSRNGMKRTLKTRSGIHSNNGDFLYSMVKAGAGVAVLPDFIVARGLKSGEVEEVLPGWSAPPLWLSLYYPPYEALPPLVATFTDFFEAFLAGREGFEF